MHLQDIMGFVIRSRHNQNSEEEKASLFHAAREVKNSKNNIEALKVDGAVVKDNSLIEKTVTSFFGALFNGFHNSDLQITGVPFEPDFSAFNEITNGLGYMTDSESRDMEEAVSMEELEDILKTCKNNKSRLTHLYP